MNKQELILLLQACRPNGQDADDPRFAPALELVQRDPALERWFAEQQEFDRTISERLCRLPVPPTLKEELLATQVQVKPSAWNLASAWLMLAASLVLVVFVALNWRNDSVPADFAEYRADIIPLAVELSKQLEFRDPDLAPLEKALAQAGAPVPKTLPPVLRHLPSTGCRVIPWKWRKVSLIYYLPKGLELYLLVVRRDGFQGVPPAEIPALAQSGAWSIACWTDEQAIYLLAAQAPPQVLQRYL